MRQNPFGGGRQSHGGQRRGIGINPRFIILIGFLLYGGYYWFSNRTEDPYTGEQVLIDSSISVSEEKALGLQAYEDILSKERPVDPNSQVARQVREIARRLIEKVPEVEAAMAVYTGLLPVAKNADAVAVVMGHEIAHALLRHGAQRMSQQKLSQIGQMAGSMSGMDPQQQQMIQAAMGYGYLLPYARKHESQADEVGLMLAAAACFNPEEAVPLWERMSEASGGQAPPEFSSTHPNPGTRIQNLQALMPKAMEYRKKFCRE
jgi:hypothetical protein